MDRLVAAGVRLADTINYITDPDTRPGEWSSWHFWHDSDCAQCPWCSEREELERIIDRICCAL